MIKELRKHTVVYCYLQDKEIEITNCYTCPNYNGDIGRKIYCDVVEVKKR